MSSAMLTESSPLLPRTVTTIEGEEVHQKFFCNPSLWIICLIFTCGSFIGGYLLYEQAQEYPISRPFFLVHRTKWGATPQRPTGPPYPVDNPVTRILIAQVAVETCHDVGSCSKLLRDMQKCDKTGDVPFNFLVAADGNTYEGQGWHNQSLVSLPEGATGPKEDTQFSFVLAFIGDFTSTQPNLDQLDEAQVWIAESISRRFLSEQYMLMGLRNLTQSANDGQQLFKAIERWPNYNSTIGAYL